MAIRWTDLDDEWYLAQSWAIRAAIRSVEPNMVGYGLAVAAADCGLRGLGRAEITRANRRKPQVWADGAWRFANDGELAQMLTGTSPFRLRGKVLSRYQQRFPTAIAAAVGK